MLGHKKQSKPSPFDKKSKNNASDQQKSFSVIQWDRLQKFNLLFLSVTLFSDLCDKTKYAWEE